MRGSLGTNQDVLIAPRSVRLRSASNDRLERRRESFNEFALAGETTANYGTLFVYKYLWPCCRPDLSGTIFNAVAAV